MYTRLAVLVSCMLLCAGCASNASKKSAGTSSLLPAQGKTADQTPLGKEGIQEGTDVRAHPALAQVMSSHVYFDFNDDRIREADQKVIIAQVNYMKAHVNAQLRLVGNTDERGSTEYNLALGQRRAYMVKKAMMSLDIPTKRLEAISYGKEKPLMPGHTEADWAKNRRVDFMYY